MSEPGRGAGGRALCDGVAGLTESRDGGRVPLPRRALDVVRALRRGCTAGGERLGAALVGAQPPAAGRRLVDRAPDERVPEAKAARHLGLANEVELRAARPRPRAPTPRRSPRRRRRARVRTGRRLPPPPPARAVRGPTEERAPRPARPRPRAARRDPSSESSHGSACSCAQSERTGELLEIERVAAALLVERGCRGGVDRLAEELASLAARQRADFERGAASPRGAPARARRRQPLRRLARTDAPAR